MNPPIPTDGDRETRENAAALKPGDVFTLSGDWGDEAIEVVEDRGSYYVPFPGYYARAVLVKDKDDKTREVMLKPDVAIEVVTFWNGEDE